MCLRVHVCVCTFTCVRGVCVCTNLYFCMCVHVYECVCMIYLCVSVYVFDVYLFIFMYFCVSLSVLGSVLCVLCVNPMLINCLIFFGKSSSIISLVLIPLRVLPSTGDNVKFPSSYIFKRNYSQELTHLERSVIFT